MGISFLEVAADDARVILADCSSSSETSSSETSGDTIVEATDSVTEVERGADVCMTTGLLVGIHECQRIGAKD